MVARRILIVESSVMFRRLLVDELQGHSDLDLVGVVSSAGFALSKIASIRPDFIIVDVDPPNVGTREMIAEIHSRYPVIEIVVCSTPKDRQTRRALFAAGALHFISRPECALCRTTFHAAVHDLLLDVLRRGPPPERPSLPQLRPEERNTRYAKYPELCVIGASTGGPNALSELFRRLPRPDVPLVVVQHMPPVFTTKLAARLSGEGEIPFVEVEDGMRAAPRRGYLAPGDFHVHVERDATGLYFRLSQAPPENSVRPSVDVLFESAANTAGARVLGVVLTGMGVDGRRGAAAIRAAGGQILAQDQASSVVWGMPGAVVLAGHANAVVALAELTGELRQRLPFSARRTMRVKRVPFGG